MPGTLHNPPAIDRIGYDCTKGRTMATCWFSNGAMLRYRETESGAVLEETFHPTDPQTTWESVKVGDSEVQSGMTACESLVESLAEYDWYVRNDAGEKLQDDWPLLAEILFSSDDEYRHRRSRHNRGKADSRLEE